MHLRRLACFLLGSWLTGSVLMLCVTTWNYEAADALAGSHSPETTKLFYPLRGEQARMLVFHISNEASRSYGTAWESLQLAIGLAVAAALFLERRTRFYSIGIGLMLVLVLFECYAILPQLDWLGRSADFVSWRVNSQTRDQYWNLRAVFLGMESLKMLLGLGITGALLIARSRGRSELTQVEALESNQERPQSLRKTRTRSSSHGSRKHSTST